MKAIIWDFNGTLYNPKTKKLCYKTKDILDKCSKRYQQALVSSDMLHPNKRKTIIKKLGIEKYFKHIEINFKTIKTFLNICRLFKYKPCEFYVIGDNYSKEIKVGNKLNMKTIWITRKEPSIIKRKILRIKYWKIVNNISSLESVIDL